MGRYEHRGTGIHGAALGLLLALVGAAPAAATTTTIGATDPAPGAGNANGTLVQVSSASPAASYVIPYDGVITSWSMRAGTTGGTAKVKLFRATGNPNEWEAMADSPQGTVAASTLNTFNLLPGVRVHAAEHLGLKTSGPLATFSGNGTTTVFNSEPAVGSTATTSFGPYSNVLNLEAVVETDHDGDLLGDDSQDSDDDGDGVADSADLYPLDASESADSDGDGIGDNADPDDDNDGTPDSADAFPRNASEHADTDGDGIGNDADSDDDGDGVPDAADAFPLDRGESADSDLDGRGDNGDTDDDNDGLSDTAEAALHSSRVDVDSDDDGLGDREEAQVTHTSPVRADSDRDGLPDGLERGRTRPLADPPGIVLGTLATAFRPDRDPRTKTNPRRKDTDRDGLRDGREDRNHNGRRDRRETDPRKRDTDGDRVPDGRDRSPLKRSRS